MKIKRGQTVPLTLNCFRSNYVINSSMTRNNKSNVLVGVQMIFLMKFYYLIGAL